MQRVSLAGRGSVSARVSSPRGEGQAGASDHSAAACACKTSSSPSSWEEGSTMLLSSRGAQFAGVDTFSIKRRPSCLPSARTGVLQPSSLPWTPNLGGVHGVDVDNARRAGPLTRRPSLQGLSGTRWRGLSRTRRMSNCSSKSSSADLDLFLAPTKPDDSIMKYSFHCMSDKIIILSIQAPAACVHSPARQATHRGVTAPGRAGPPGSHMASR